MCVCHQTRNRVVVVARDLLVTPPLQSKSEKEIVEQRYESRKWRTLRHLHAGQNRQ